MKRPTKTGFVRWLQDNPTAKFDPNCESTCAVAFYLQAEIESRAWCGMRHWCLGDETTPTPAWAKRVAARMVRTPAEALLALGVKDA